MQKVAFQGSLIVIRVRVMRRLYILHFSMNLAFAKPYARVSFDAINANFDILIAYYCQMPALMFTEFEYDVGNRVVTNFLC